MKKKMICLLLTNFYYVGNPHLYAISNVINQLTSILRTVLSGGHYDLLIQFREIYSQILLR